MAMRITLAACVFLEGALRWAVPQAITPPSDQPKRIFMSAVTLPRPLPKATSSAKDFTLTCAVFGLGGMPTPAQWAFRVERRALDIRLCWPASGYTYVLTMDRRVRPDPLWHARRMIRAEQERLLLTQPIGYFLIFFNE